MENIVRIGILFDFYGKLLSDRQYDAIELYYIHDLSLSEIGEELDISRQSVYETLKRGEEKLIDYEENLRLVRKDRRRTERLRDVYSLALEIENESKNESIKEKAMEIRRIIDKNLKDSQEVG